MAETGTRAVALLVAGVVTVGAVAWWRRRKPKKKTPKGVVRCPAKPVPAKELRIGDYAIIELATPDGSFHEHTWARIDGSTPEGRIRATLIGETGEFGEPKAIGTDKHGFKLGTAITFPSTCVSEVYRPTPKPGHILCGTELPVEIDPEPHADLLKVGDYAQFLVTDPQDNLEELWAQVVHLGPEHQVLYGIISSVPEQQEQHGYGAGDQVVFLRDCIVDVSLGGPPVVPEPEPEEGVG